MIPKKKKKKRSDCAPIKLYLQEQVADKSDQRASLLTPGLKHKSIKKKKMQWLAQAFAFSGYFKIMLELSLYVLEGKTSTLWPVGLGFR